MEMIEKANFLQRGFILVLLTCTCMVLADYIDNDVSCPMAISCPSIKAPGSDDVIQLVKKKVPRGHPMAIPQQMKGIDLNIVCSIPACLSNPCLHGGTCHETNDGYECHCLFSFTGKRCQELTSIQEDTTTTPDSTTTLSPTAANSESTFIQDDTTTTTTTTLSNTAADYELTSIQDDTITPDSTTTLSPTAANSESTSTQDDTTTTTTTLSPTAANSESTSTQDDTTTTTTTLSPTAADSESTFTQDDTTTTTTLSTTAADYDEDITTEGSTNSQFPPDSPGWFCTSSKCYRLYDDKERNWPDAKAFCSELDPVNTPYGYRSPSLLFLNTEEEAIFLRDNFDMNKFVWINCNDQAKEDDFVCDVDGNGTSPSSFWWKDGEPDGSSYGEADCVAVKRGWSELLKWHNVPCSLKRYTMCQYIVGQPEQ